MAQQCQHRKPDGTQCKRMTLGELCAAHDPERQAEFKAIQRRGHQGRAKKAKEPAYIPRTVDEIAVEVGKIAAQVREAELPVTRGEAAVRMLKLQERYIEKAEAREKDRLASLTDQELIVEAHRAIAELQEVMA